MSFLKKYHHVYLFAIISLISISSIFQYMNFKVHNQHIILESEYLKQEFIYYLIHEKMSCDVSSIPYSPLFRLLDITGGSDSPLIDLFSTSIITEQRMIVTAFNNRKNVFLIILGLLCCLLCTSLFSLILSLFRLHHNRKNEDYKERVHRKMLDILEKDRNLISCELHDDLAQKLAMINRYFSNPDLNEETLSLLKKYSSDSIQQVRLVSHRLKTPGITGIREAYEEFFSDFKLLTGINLDFRLVGVSALELDEETNVHIFRIVQELLNNAYKHSQAQKVFLSLLYTHPHIVVKYSDNGVGYSFEESKNRGLGLSSIQFRMNMLGADWIQRDTMSPGVNLMFKVPVNE